MVTPFRYLCIVPTGTMQHPVLLRRDSWTCYSQRITYTILPRRPSQPIFGGIPLSVLRNEGLFTFTSDNRLNNDPFRLDFAGVHEISLYSTTFLVSVNLVRS